MKRVIVTLIMVLGLLGTMVSSPSNASLLNGNHKYEEVEAEIERLGLKECSVEELINKLQLTQRGTMLHSACLLTIAEASYITKLPLFPKESRRFGQAKK